MKADAITGCLLSFFFFTLRVSHYRLSKKLIVDSINMKSLKGHPLSMKLSEFDKFPENIKNQFTALAIVKRNLSQLEKTTSDNIIPELAKLTDLSIPYTNMLIANVVDRIRRSQHASSKNISNVLNNLIIDNELLAITDNEYATLSDSFTLENTELQEIVDTHQLVQTILREASYNNNKSVHVLNDQESEILYLIDSNQLFEFMSRYFKHQNNTSTSEKNISMACDTLKTSILLNKALPINIDDFKNSSELRDFVIDSFYL